MQRRNFSHLYFTVLSACIVASAMMTLSSQHCIPRECWMTSAMDTGRSITRHLLDQTMGSYSWNNHRETQTDYPGMKEIDVCVLFADQKGSFHM